MIIEWQQLSPQALQGLAEQYIHSESGEQIDDSYSLEQKSGQVISAVKRGDLLITWSELHQSAYLQHKDKFRAAAPEQDTDLDQGLTPAQDPIRSSYD